jgi:toxin ParE1/3/4
MRIRWLLLALDDIDNIASYISQDDPVAAKKSVLEIWRVSNLLKNQPHAGHPGRVTGTREIYVFGTSYIIPYRIKNDEIQILRVLHTSRKWPDSF